MYDYVFRNANVVDGTGRKAYRADVAVYSSLICLIAEPGTLGAKHVIEKPELVLCPGFIDIHSHDDLEVLRNAGMESKLMQGITLDVNGNCGIGLFPILGEESELRNGDKHGISHITFGTTPGCDGKGCEKKCSAGGDREDVPPA